MKYCKSSNFGQLGSKTRSLGQMKEIHCGRSRYHKSCSIDMKIGQNFSLDKISGEFEFESPGVKKLGHEVKRKKYVVGTLKATFLAQLT